MRKLLSSLAAALLLGAPSAGFASATALPLVRQPQAATNLFAALTPHQLRQTQNQVDVTISFPYKGDADYWQLIFRDPNDGHYLFDLYTNSSTAASGYLATIDAGTYTVDFSLVYGDPYGVYDFTAGTAHTYNTHELATVYNATFTQDDHHISIEKYY